MLHISLFSGVGGFDLAAQWMGWKNIVSCEINEFGNKHLEFYWPEAYHHRDIHTLDYATINAELSKRFGTRWRNDDIILTGGFP
jgi:DNA (cytosine-5)-methyltransferase 1